MILMDNVCFPKRERRKVVGYLLVVFKLCYFDPFAIPCIFVYCVFLVGPQNRNMLWHKFYVSQAMLPYGHTVYSKLNARKGLFYLTMITGSYFGGLSTAHPGEQNVSEKIMIITYL